MQKRSIVTNPGLLFGIIASLLLHGSLLGVKAFQRPAETRFDSGVVSVELTLLPSIASVATAEPSPEEPPPIPVIKEPAKLQSLETPAPIQPEPMQVMPEPAEPQSVNAEEQDGSSEKDKGAVSQAQPTTACAPIYPRISRRRGEEGVVVLSVDVSASGHGSNIQIVQSSGHSRLDKAAVNALEKAQFTSAVRFGQPCDSTLTQTFNFQLRNAR